MARGNRYESTKKKGEEWKKKRKGNISTEKERWKNKQKWYFPRRRRSRHFIARRTKLTNKEAFLLFLLSSLRYSQLDSFYPRCSKQFENHVLQPVSAQTRKRVDGNSGCNMWSSNCFEQRNVSAEILISYYSYAKRKVARILNSWKIALLFSTFNE